MTTDWLRFVMCIAAFAYLLPALRWFYAWCSTKAAAQRYEEIQEKRTLKSLKRRIRLGMAP